MLLPFVIWLLLLFGGDGGANASVIISEIMYNPKQGKAFEFIELHNTVADANVNIGGWRLSGAVTFTFPSGATIPSNGYVVVVNSTSSMLTAYPYLSSSSVFGPMSGHLSNSGDTLTMQESSGALVVSFAYNNKGDWDFAADGYGSSLELICDTADPKLASSWRASSTPTSADAYGEYNGSPGKQNQWIACPAPTMRANTQNPNAYDQKVVEFSEVMYEPFGEITDQDIHEFVELYNPSSTNVVDLSYWRMVSANTNDAIQFNIPKGTTIAPRSYLVIAKDTKAFAQVYPNVQPSLVIGGYQGELSNSDGSLALLDTNGQGVIQVPYSSSFPWPMGAASLGADPEDIPYPVNTSSMQYTGYSLQRLSFDYSGKKPENWVAGRPTPGTKNVGQEVFPCVLDKNVTQTQSALTPKWQLSSSSPTTISVSIAPNNATNVKVEYYIYNPINKTRTDSMFAMMQLNNQGNFVADIPQYPDNTIVRFRITGQSLGSLGTRINDAVLSPRNNDPILWHSYFITPSIATTSSIYHLFINPTDWGQLWTNLQGGLIFNNSLGPCCGLNLHWNDRVPATLVFKGDVFDVMVRYQGSPYNRVGGADLPNWPSNMLPNGGPYPLKALSWSINLPKWGDIMGRQSILLNKLWQGCGQITSLALYQVAAQLGLTSISTPGMGRLYINGNYYRFVLDLSAPTTSLVKNYLNDYYEPNCYVSQPREVPGNLYKAKGQGCWAAPVGNANEEKMYDSCGYTAYERYQLTYALESNSKFQNHMPLSNMILGLSKVPVTSSMDPVARQWFDQNFDVNHMLSYMTLVNWGGAWDDFVSNHMIYQRVTDGKWTMTPYDLKTLWGQEPPCESASLSTCPINLGEAGAPVNPSTQKPGAKEVLKNAFIKAFRFELEQRFLELADTVLHPDRLLPLFDASFAAFKNGDGAADFSYYADSTQCLNGIKTWHTQRWQAVKAGYSPKPHNYTYQFCPLKANRTQILHNTYKNVPGQPLPPSGALSATSSSTLMVNWSPSNPNGYNITEYNLQKLVDGSWVSMSKGLSLVYLDPNITFGSSYTYRVYATNQLGTSPVSDIGTILAVEATPAPTPAPSLATTSDSPHDIHDSASASSSSGSFLVVILGAAVVFSVVAFSRPSSRNSHPKHD